MARIGIRTETPVRFTLPETRGVWWLPDDPERVVDGTVCFDDSDGGVLRLEAPLSPRVWTGEPTFESWNCVILGRIEGHEACTLMDARLARQAFDTSGSWPQVTKETFSCSTVLVGGHLQAGMDAPITRMTLHSSVLNSWVWTPPAQHGGGFGEPHVLTYTTPDRLKAFVRGGELSLGWEGVVSTGIDGTFVSSDPCWTYIPAEPMGFEDFIDQFVVPFLRLGTFATGEHDGVINLTLSVGNRPETYVGGSVLHAGLPTPRPARDRRFTYEIPIPYRVLEHRFETLIPAWFELNQLAGAELALAHASSVHEGIVLEDAFNECVRSLEQWHEAVHGGHLMPDDEYSSILERIEGALTPEEWELVAPRILKGNRPSLKVRLTQLAEHCDWLIGIWILSTPRFLRRVVDQRDGYIHGFERKRPFDRVQMWWALQSLRWLLHQSVLLELGFNHAEAGLLMQRSDLGRLVADARRNVLEIEAAGKDRPEVHSRVWLHDGYEVGEDIDPRPPSDKG